MHLQKGARKAGAYSAGRKATSQSRIPLNFHFPKVTHPLPPCLGPGLCMRKPPPCYRSPPYLVLSLGGFSCNSFCRQGKRSRMQKVMTALNTAQATHTKSGHSGGSHRRDEDQPCPPSHLLTCTIRDPELAELLAILVLMGGGRSSPEGLQDFVEEPRRERLLEWAGNNSAAITAWKEPLPLGASVYSLVQQQQLTLTQHLLRARHCTELFTVIISSDPRYNPGRLMLFLSPFYS